MEVGLDNWSGGDTRAWGRGSLGGGRGPGGREMAKPPLTRPGPSRPRAREDAFPASREFSRPEPRVCSGTDGSCRLPGSSGAFLCGGETAPPPPLRGCSAVAEGGGDGVPPAGSA